MKLDEGYNVAVKEFGKRVADIMKQNGIPKNFIRAACRFYTKEGVSLEQLQDDWKKWNRYILNNPNYTDDSHFNKNVDAFTNYKDFKAEIQKAQEPYLCPNAIYNDGNLSIGECKSQRDARWFPPQNLSGPEGNNDFCICKKLGGYKNFLKYLNLGYRILLIYDKSRSATDPYKRMVVLVKNGILSFWNNFDKPCGTTKHSKDPIWKYIDTLPRKAQIALSRFAEGEITENKIYKNMKKNVKRINESQLRAIVAESVKKVLKEGKQPSRSDINFQKGYRCLMQALSWFEQVDFYDMCKGCGYENGKAREIQLNSDDIVRYLKHRVLDGDWAMLYNSNSPMFQEPHSELNGFKDTLEKHTGGTYSPESTRFNDFESRREHSNQSDDEMYTDDYIKATQDYIRNKHY